MADPIQIIITQGGQGGAGLGLQTGNPAMSPSLGGGAGGTQRGFSRGGFGLLGNNPVDQRIADTNAATAATVVAAIQITQAAISYAAQIIKNEASLQAKVSGDYVASNTVQQITDVSTRVINYGLNIGKAALTGAAIGAIIGTVGGPVGMVAGAGIGAAGASVFGILKTVNQLKTDIANQAMEYIIMQTQTNADRQRAGFYTWSGSRNTRY